MLFEASTSLTTAQEAFGLLASLDLYYPGFADWYRGKVIPGVVSGADVLLTARDNGILVGVALGKRSVDETKLRCIRVHESYQNTGVGLRLTERMFEALGTDKPHCTVAEELFHVYSRPFIRRYGFTLSDVDKGAYRKSKLEYKFN